MGFHLRKSFNLGGIRLNLSSSGMGFSTGVKGLRVGIDSKGRAYVGGGKGPIRYRKTFSAGTSLSSENFTSSDAYSIKPLGCFLSFIGFFAMFPVLGFYLTMTAVLGSNHPLLVLLLWGAGIYGLFFCIYSFNFPKAYRMSKKGLKYYNKGDFAKALYCFEYARDKFLGSKLYETKYPYHMWLNDSVYNSHIAMENYKQALSFLDRSVCSNHNEKKVICLYKLEDWESLISHIQSSYNAEEREEHPSLCAMLGEAFLELGQADIALETLLSGPVNKRKMTDEMCAFRYTLGRCYEATNDFNNALKQYQKVYATDIDYEDISERIKNLSKSTQL